MNLLYTLFGGMILTALLYGLGRWLRLSNFWAAVLGCGIPTVLYLVMAIGAWPGLDVVTMHVVAYPTVAVLLFQLYGAKADHAKTLHWAPKLMIGFFLSISVLFGFLIYVSSQGLPPALAHYLLPNTQGKTIHTGFAGVVAHRQSDTAKSIGQHLSNAHKLNQLGWNVEVNGLGDLQPGQERSVRVRLKDRAGAGVNEASVSLALSRPGSEPELNVNLAKLEPGLFSGLVTVSGTGTWVAHTTLQSGDETIRLEHAFALP